MLQLWIDRHYFKITVVLIVILIATAVYYLDISSEDISKIQKLIASLPGKPQNEQIKIVKTLLEKAGPTETQELLLTAGLPYDGQTHLVIHAIGDYIYEKFGKEGLIYCKDYFLNACFHDVIIRTLAKEGDSEIKNILSECRKISPNTYAMCAHGSGHGFLAWTDYDLLPALSLCDKFDDLDSGLPSLHCHVGIFMENIYGLHRGGPIKNNPWLSEADPYYPCNAVKEKYASGCWLNQATRMYDMFAGNFKKVAEACDNVTHPKHQEECYNNFARHIQPVSQGKYDKGRELCQAASGTKWQNYCLSTLALSTMTLGDYYDVPFKLCEDISDSMSKKNCYFQLSSYVLNSAFPDEQKQEICINIKNEDAFNNCLRNRSL